MKMHIGKWGNSLAVRLPRELVEQFGLKEGDDIPAEGLKADLADEKRNSDLARRAAALEALQKGRFSLPPDWKFDREEANWRPAMDR
jgi:antitoxin MazE